MRLVEAMRSSTRERQLFAIGAVLVALHVVVDNFIAPQRGTGWSDHLGAGLVPLALLAAAVIVYPRLAPGARAMVAIGLGALALEGAALAAADASSTFARASDWTGFLLAPAGVSLCGRAGVLLWRSRKSRGHRHLRRTLLVVAAAFGAYSLVLPVGMALVATHRPRAAVAADLGAAHRDVTIRTADGLRLAAWYVPSRNGAAVISFPTRIGKLAQARMLIRHGYGVFTLDMRGYDGSGGSPNAFGWGATKDIDAAVAWLQGQSDVDRGRIGGIGFSVGGEQMLEAAAENAALRAVVSEGAGERSVRETVLYGARGWISIPSAFVQTAALSVLSDTSPPPSLKDVVARIAPRPIFLIYAGHGAGGEELNAAYYRAAGDPRSIWKIPEAHHVGGLTVRPVEYERRVIGFFDRALLSADASRPRFLQG
jgi:uncharacterized protein